MKKSKAKRATSWLIAAAVASSVCAFEANVVSATDTQITSTTESLGNGTYFISDAVGLKRLAELTNASRVAPNTETPEMPTVGGEWNGGGGAHIFT